VISAAENSKKFQKSPKNSKKSSFGRKNQLRTW
jgi:hypothetical protein